MIFESIEKHKSKPTQSHHFEINKKILFEYMFYKFSHNKTYKKYQNKFKNDFFIFHKTYIK